ncbi:MAG: 30S ribosomal protein S27ae [Candidatus Huberarchaeum crystalense]|uniref:Small ribosomal subunit protein eS31 n=1 Tax=Huberarchaeum crystalense TaxID=2014257 RepID=A0A2G9LIU5_HUBC1|nr:30S ribosomal protein S27ae [archaeon]PIN66459.1 MAG: 30S ribosomal protein S27ae [Candidatus Huberarchaeum crystalense]NCS98169.1 30S ribosomal protein S27ae [archaeon]PIV13729.1 MAG: 30S ribosomal protein S27ae [Candidatus Huberarchaeum crystalense]PIV46601.1 MAG: 30S ribosomal protein S27ae [Candidatus Huberarchaeum crystalense]
MAKKQSKDQKPKSTTKIAPGAAQAKQAAEVVTEIKKKKEKKGKKAPKQTISPQKWKAYELKDGKLVKKNKVCPKCGAGVFLSIHKDRMHCGKCGYIEKIKVQIS